MFLFFFDYQTKSQHQYFTRQSKRLFCPKQSTSFKLAVACVNILCKKIIEFTFADWFISFSLQNVN